MKSTPVAIEMTSNYKPKPQSRVVQRRSSEKEKRRSRNYSSSEEDFHSDDNLRPYEEVKMAHHDKKLNGLGKRFNKLTKLYNIYTLV